MVLVGNGPGATRWTAGALIDKAVDVVRFNNFQVDGFEDFVGSKTTIWVRNDTAGIHPREAPRTIVVSKPERPKDGCLLPPLYRGGWASTGVTAALYFLGAGREVALHGFDFFQAPTHHYFGDYARNLIHDPEEERRLLEPYFMSGQLTVLDLMRPTPAPQSDDLQLDTPPTPPGNNSLAACANLPT